MAYSIGNSGVLSNGFAPKKYLLEQYRSIGVFACGGRYLLKQLVPLVRAVHVVDPSEEDLYNLEVGGSSILTQTGIRVVKKYYNQFIGNNCEESTAAHEIYNSYNNTANVSKKVHFVIADTDDNIYPFDSTIPALNDFTVSYVGSVGGTMRVFEADAIARAYIYCQPSISSGRLGFNIGGTAVTVDNLGTTTLTNMHVATIKRKGSTLTFFLNGVKVGTGTSSATSTCVNFMPSQVGSNYFSEAFLLNKCLPDSEVINLQNQQKIYYGI